MKAVALLLLACPWLMAWTVTAVSKGPNQINLTWAAQPAPGYGYLIEIQSAGDSRYPSFTVLQPIPTASGYTCDPSIAWPRSPGGTVTGCNISDPGAGVYVYNPIVKGVPTWVVEPQYVDPQDGTRAQFIASNLKNNTAYSFRVRTFVGNTSPTYGTYSSTATATTANYTLRYITTTGSDGNLGTAIDDAHAWGTLEMIGTVACGTLVLVSGGDYGNTHIGIGQDCPQSAKIVVQNQPGQTVNITTNSHTDYGAIFSIYGNGVVIDGIGVHENYQPDDVFFIQGHNNALFGMDIGPTLIPTAYGGVRIKGDYNLLYGNYIHDFGSPYAAQNMSGNGGYLISVGTDGTPIGTTIWSNHLTRGAHDGAFFKYSINGKALNNIADGGWGMAFETIYDTTNTLLEGYIAVYQGALLASIYKPAFEASSAGNTVRRSIFAHGGKAIEIRASWTAVNQLVYNNVFYDWTRCYFQSSDYGVTAYDGVKVQNNICMYTDDISEIYNANQTPGAISYNAFWKIGGTGVDAGVAWDWNDLAGAHVTIAYADANYTPAFGHNAARSTAAPTFVDAANMDFHLAGATLALTGATITDPNYSQTYQSPVGLGAFGLTPATVTLRTLLMK